MSPRPDVGFAEDQFFGALLQGDGGALDRVLAADFRLIDVMSGAEITRHTLLELVGSGQLVFESVERIDARVRLYPGTAIVTGQTRMRGRFGDQPFGTHSRYTHVYVAAVSDWRLVTAQGTPITAPPDAGSD
jgi:Domain of unknown function (DUF4440)